MPRLFLFALLCAAAAASPLFPPPADPPLPALPPGPELLNQGPPFITGAGPYTEQEWAYLLALLSLPPSGILAPELPPQPAPPPVLPPWPISESPSLPIPSELTSSTAAQVPEPATLPTAALGLLAAALFRGAGRQACTRPPGRPRA